ncbi:hypothetical protein CLV59_102580 [Chitinophaga dinghuensis]|uniref:Uncharacterized protein n=1 Tax=Chitinophaga dinghuensis TaxID=1539050 RepID=A0A327W902_9BACT|nr:hypothetical protein [Chitinophaga dinghuensis]RAJ85873.1 hypothetical protein CLV59_102580 [Chitinophaga dinghuensis]
MSMEQEETSIFEESDFKTEIEKGKAYPRVGQLFMLIPVALGLVFLLVVPWGIYLLSTRQVNGQPDLTAIQESSQSRPAVLTFGVSIGLFLFMYWKKRKQEPGFQIKMEQPGVGLLAKVFMTLFLSYTTVMLLGQSLGSSPLQLTLFSMEEQLHSIGVPLTFLIYALVIPILSSLMVYSIGYDGLLKNYSYKSVFYIGVVGLSILYIQPGLILIALPIGILNFLVFYKTRNILNVIIPGIALQIILLLTISSSNTDDILDIARSIPVWGSCIIAALAGLSWYVLLQDLRKMEIPDSNNFESDNNYI